MVLRANLPNCIQQCRETHCRWLLVWCFVRAFLVCVRHCRRTVQILTGLGHCAWWQRASCPAVVRSCGHVRGIGPACQWLGMDPPQLCQDTHAPPAVSGHGLHPSIHISKHHLPAASKHHLPVVCGHGLQSCGHVYWFPSHVHATAISSLCHYLRACAKHAAAGAQQGADKCTYAQPSCRLCMRWPCRLPDCVLHSHGVGGLCCWHTGVHDCWPKWQSGTLCPAWTALSFHKQPGGAFPCTPRVQTTLPCLF